MELDSWETSSPSCLLYYNNIFIRDFSGIDAAIKLRPREDELHELGPDFQSRWKDYFANKPDKPISWMMGASRCVFSLIVIKVIK